MTVYVKKIGRHYFVENLGEYDDKKEYILAHKVRGTNHCVYVRQRYKDVSNERFDELVYECLNSWGFKEPTVYIKMDDESITNVFEVDMKFKPLKYEKGMPHGGNCNGECLENDWDKIWDWD